MHAYVCVGEREKEEGGEREKVRESDAIKPPTLPFHLFVVSVRKLRIILFC
jgi:hypothetical protein